MSLWILDTDCITLFQHGFLPVVRRIRMTNPEELFVTIVSCEEQLRGRLNMVRNASNPGKLARAYDELQVAQKFFCRMNILSFSMEAETVFGDLRRNGIRIGTQDLRIASIALVHTATLVTRNQRDFSQVPQLQLEDWSF